MLPNRSITLGGEGCPDVGISRSAKNRNILGVLDDRALPPRAGSGRTVQEQTGSVDTRLTHETKFMFAFHSGRK
jgi:hypothetical protein